jgi:hypothetical protein
VTGTHLRIPEHVVYREVVRETVVFNIQTGAYHSLPRGAAQMLALIERHGTVEDTAAEIARRTGRPLESVRRSLAAYCLALARSGVLELNARPAGPRPPGQGSRAA